MSDRSAGLLCAVLLFAGAAAAESSPQLASLPADLTELSLDQLMNIEITSVSKRAEPLFHAAAAVFVITADDIRRSGARTIPEALRLVPGLTVARIGDINTYVVSSRGFADRLSDKLEVLVDGRSLYTPLFSGVFWDATGVFLPDIERIEVIRGPGATLWGTNAINGVINIVTRNAADTHGGYFDGIAGTEERASAALREGAAVGTAGDVRFYARQFERAPLKDVNGDDTYNTQREGLAGLRSDWRPAAGHALTVQGDVYNGKREDQFVSPPETGDVETSGGNVRAHWAWQTDAASEVSAQAYYDHSRRFIPTIVFRESRDNGSLEVQHRLIGAHNTLIYGASYRESHDVTGQPPLVFIFVPSSQTLQYFGGFVQDQFLITPVLEVTAGSKFEHNDYTGWELQPNVRLGATLTDTLFAWGAVSRAVRTPNRLDHDLAVFNPGFRVGNPDQMTEKLIAYEAGGRMFVTDGLSADLALFYNDYDDLRSGETNPPPFGTFGNGVAGHSTGAELSVNWKPAGSLEVRFNYAQLHLDLHTKPGSTDTVTAQTTEDLASENQAGLRLTWRPLATWSTDAFLRYQDRLSRRYASGETTLPAYAELTLRTAWRPWKNLELAVLGENLLDRQHGEFLTEIPTAYSEVPRSGLLEMSWTWD